MSNKKKNSRVGMGMKPRGTVPQSRTPAAVVDEKTPENASADAVQPEGAKVIDSEFPEVGETPNTPVQILDPSVAEADPLDDLLEKSKEPTPLVFDGSKLGDFKVEPENSRIEMVVTGLTQGHTPETSTDEVFGPGAKVVAPSFIRGLGEQPDGTFKLAITIPEGYIDPIREQAESDRMSAEEWCSMRFQEIMDTWWQRAPGR